MLGFTHRGDKNVDDVKGSVAQTWTQQRLIKFLVAHVSFVGDPVSVVLYRAQLFQQTSISLLVSCGHGGCRLDATVGFPNVT